VRRRAVDHVGKENARGNLAARGTVAIAGELTKSEVGNSESPRMATITRHIVGWGQHREPAALGLGEKLYFISPSQSLAATFLRRAISSSA
jgi:hypothetical protein